MAEVAAVVLAAGSSRRYGANKLLVEVEGRPLVARTVDVVVGAGVRDIVVVLGHDADAVQRALSGRNVSFVQNPAHESGMGSSIACGVSAVGRGSEGCLIVLADMPGLASSTVARLIGRFDESGSTDAIVAPMADGRRGNPVLFGQGHFPELTALTGNEGARAVLARNRDALATIEVEAFELDDLDWPVSRSSAP